MPLTRRMFLALALCLSLAASVRGAVGDGRIATWKHDRAAVFLLMFDDGWPSHWQMAVPALQAREMIATFYINPGKGEFTKFTDKWAREIWKTGMVYGNHTWSHQGVKDLPDAEREIGQCNAFILDNVPGPKPRLISYGQPGVGPGKWNITDAELRTLLQKHHLIDRPPFKGHGAVYHLKTADQMLALADQAIAAGGMEYLVFHGIERREPHKWGYQDFWPLNFDVFSAVLDGLKERRDAGRLWITDHISYHQYQVERDSASLRTVEAGSARIVLELKASADPALYDHPLTLVVDVPPAWKSASVTQGKGSGVTAPVEQGKVRFEAVPNGGPITVVQARDAQAGDLTEVTP